MSFQPYLFIGVGATHALFTLRETYEYVMYVRGVPYTEYRSFHHKNLGADPEESFAKAVKAAKELSIPLKTTIEELANDLREISRLSHEEVEEARKAQILADIEYKLEFTADNDYKIMLRAVIKGGINKFGFGKYLGKSYSNVVVFDRDYIEYILTTDFVDELTSFQLEGIIEKEPVPEPSEYVGEVGERSNFSAVVKRIAYFETQYGSSAAVTLADNEGNELMLFTTASFPDIGVPFTFAAKVKEHKEYNDVKQTVLQRPTKIKEVE